MFYSFGGGWLTIALFLVGARRFVTLDFGRPILLTDVLIPTCADLASLSIDIWTLGEEVDGRRLVVATDISTHSLILHDLVPPPVCRFMKVSPSTLPQEAPRSGVGSPTRHCVFFLGLVGGLTQMGPCFIPDHSHWPLWKHQRQSQDPTGLLLRPHVHPAMGERAEAHARPTAGRGRGCCSA